MNYILQLRAFDDFKLYDTKLSAGQNALWYALMSINNKSNWKTWFTVANSMLENLSGLSRSGIAKDRNILRQLGLIDFKSNGRKATSYKVCVLYTSDSVQESAQHSTQESVQRSTQDSTQRSVQHSTQESSTLVKHKQNSKQNKINTVQAVQSTPPTFDNTDLLLEFTDFWQAYPRKQHKQNAYEAYVIARNDGATAEQLAQGAKTYAKYLEINQKSTGWTSMPENWLNKKLWTDELDLTPPAPKGQQKNVKETLPDWAKDDAEQQDKPKKQLTAEQQESLNERLARLNAQKKG